MGVSLERQARQRPLNVFTLAQFPVSLDAEAAGEPAAPWSRFTLYTDDSAAGALRILFAWYFAPTKLGDVLLPPHLVRPTADRPLLGHSRGRSHVFCVWEPPEGVRNQDGRQAGPGGGGV